MTVWIGTCNAGLGCDGGRRGAPAPSRLHIQLAGTSPHLRREEPGRGFGRSGLVCGGGFLGLVCGGGFLGLGTLVLLCPRGHTKLDKL